MSSRIAVLALTIALLASQAFAQAPQPAPAQPTPATAPAAPATGAPATAPAALVPAQPPLATPGKPVVLPYVRQFPSLGSPVTLTPGQAAALAVERSTDTAIAQQGVCTALGLLREAESLNKWTLAISGALTYQGPGSTVTFPGSTQSITFTPNTTHRETVAVNLPLWLSGRDSYSRAAARAGVQAAEENVQAAVLTVAFSARQAIYMLLRLEALVLVDQQNVTALAEHLRVTKAMFDAGTSPRFEVVQAETNLASAKGDVINDQTAVAIAKASLAALLSLPQGGEIKVEEGVPLEMPACDIYQLVDTALQGRPEIQEGLAKVRAQEANVRLAQAGNKPEVALQGIFNNQTKTLATLGQNWTLSLGLNWPLYQGGLVEGQVQVARAALETAKLNLEATTQQVALRVVQALGTVTDAREALAVAEQGETNARERARIAEVRFQNGVGLGVEVLDAQTSVAQAQTKVVNARFELQVAIAVMRSALGCADLPKEPVS